ncbi:MAG: tetratricopeptide repeat protein [Candidatus Omnitrophica bacterium]|nr:tetratricopeptide repeat protein [Candidatus Omnitrophota bacterium]
MRKIFWLIPFIFIANPLFAETLLLKSGKTVEGKITERNDKSIKVDIAGLPVTYYLDQIESINGEKIKTLSNNEPATADTANKKELYDSGNPVMHTAQVPGEESEYTVLVNIAVDSMNKKNYAAAIEGLKKAIEKSPGRSTAYLNIATCYHLMGQNQEALKYLEKAYSINPDDATIVGNLGTVYFTSGKQDEGMDYLRKAIAMEPNYGRNYYNIGIAYYQQKKYKEAEESFLKAKELCKNADDAQGVSNAEFYLNELKNIK